MQATLRIPGLVAAGAVALVLAAGCSSGSSDSASSTSSSSKSTTTSTTKTKTPSNVTVFCAGFVDLDSRRDPTVRTQTKDKAGWDLDVASVTRIAAAAPAEQVDNANAYITMMKEREALAATYDYGTVPTDAQRSFGQSHAALQTQVNALIAYAKTVCEGLK